MKKFVLVIFAALSISGLSAQEVGIRFGDGAAVDMVFGIGESRIHADAGWNFAGDNDAIYVDVLWDLIYKPIGLDALNWYIGVGGSTVIGDPFLLGVASEVGIEYRFESVPLVLGADWRPTFWLVENTDFNVSRWGVNLRWNFGG